MSLSAKEVMELMGESQSTFTDMVSELGLAAAMGPQTEYTLLAPLNSAFTSELISKNFFMNNKVVFWSDLEQDVELLHFEMQTRFRLFTSFNTF